MKVVDNICICQETCAMLSLQQHITTPGSVLEVFLLLTMSEQASDSRLMLPVRVDEGKDQLRDLQTVSECALHYTTLCETFSVIDAL